MIQEQPQEQKSFVDRVIAPTKEDEARAFAFFQKLYKNKNLKKLERIKTPEEIETILQINKAFSEFLKSYGVVHIKEIPPDKIRTVDLSQLNDEQKKNVNSVSFSGRYHPNRQDIIIIPSGSVLSDIKTIIHEMWHAQSFLSFDLDRFMPSADAGLDSKLSPRRIGLNVYNEVGNNQLMSALHAIDEAIIEELSKEFYYKYVPSISNLKDVFKEAESHKKEADIDDDDVLDLQTRQLPDGTWQSSIWSVRYKKERSDLWDLIDDIFENDKSKEFQSREDIFKLFVQAQMTGHLLKLGRVIRRVYGKGAFKFLGENTRDIKKDD